MHQRLQWGGVVVMLAGYVFERAIFFFSDISERADGERRGPAPI